MQNVYTIKKKERINTIFINEESKSQANPLSLLGKRKSIQFALKIEAVYIGTKISFQIKLYEVKYRLLESSMKSLLTDFVYPSLNQKVEVKMTNKTIISKDIKKTEKNVKKLEN